MDIEKKSERNELHEIERALGLMNGSLLLFTVGFWIISKGAILYDYKGETITPLTSVLFERYLIECSSGLISGSVLFFLQRLIYHEHQITAYPKALKQIKYINNPLRRLSALYCGIFLQGYLFCVWFPAEFIKDHLAILLAITGFNGFALSVFGHYVGTRQIRKLEEQEDSPGTS